MSAGSVAAIVAGVVVFLVLVYGILWRRCCLEQKSSLAKGPEEYQIKLDWPTRQKICVGIARGLTYLHEESRLKIVHRDIKAINVLLDKNLNPKISDFGLAKLDEEDNTGISTRIAGIYGYTAPEYAMHGYLTDKADVYSFGVVALEIVSERSNMIQRQKEEAFLLLDWVTAMINVALLCTNDTASLRPTMSSVVSMLEGRSVVQGVFSESSEALDEKKLEAM
ncbi:Putative LRR receptor-like serine/threonine-protein kinase [Glycine soja]|uniref:Putative LRR receptor-like serine/threonine-protein kinase n=1 Tax=Glycine soja TaxID=3848 RepID=A0A0B2RYB0_GLYSO|nr:Putative LRR receptor-like serine/threonine-protein kinase [Glycine soja]